MIINFRGLEGEALDILSRKIIKSLGELQIISYYLSSQGFSEEEIKKQLADYKWKLSFPGVSSDSLIELCLRVQEPPAAMKGDFSEVKIFQPEVDFIRETIVQVLENQGKRKTKRGSYQRMLLQRHRVKGDWV